MAAGPAKWFNGNRRMWPLGLALLALAGVIAWWQGQPDMLTDPDARNLARGAAAAVALLGLLFVAFPDRIRVNDATVRCYAAGFIPGHTYRHGAFRGLALDSPPTRLDLEFQSGRRLPLRSYPDAFVLYELAMQVSRAMKCFVRNGDVKLFYAGDPPTHPNFFLQHEALPYELVKSRNPLAEMEKGPAGYRLKLSMARPLPNGYHGLIVNLGPDGLKIYGEGLPLLVDLPLDEIVAIDNTTGSRGRYLGILTRTRGVMRLEGIGSPQDRYLLEHLYAGVRDYMGKPDRSGPA